MQLEQEARSQRTLDRFLSIRPTTDIDIVFQLPKPTSIPPCNTTNPIKQMEDENLLINITNAAWILFTKDFVTLSEMCVSWYIYKLSSWTEINGVVHYLHTPEILCLDHINWHCIQIISIKIHRFEISTYSGMSFFSIPASLPATSGTYTSFLIHPWLYVWQFHRFS